MARAGLGWSAKDLAERAGLGYATVARFEAGSQVDPDSLAKMEAALIAAGAEFLARKTGKVGVAVPLNG